MTETQTFYAVLDEDGAWWAGPFKSASTAEAMAERKAERWEESYRAIAYTVIATFGGTHYAPTPRSVTLPCGDVVAEKVLPFGTHALRYERVYRNPLPDGFGARQTHYWPDLLCPSDTGADFDALKAFAAEAK